MANLVGRLNDDQRCLGGKVATATQEMRGPLAAVRGALEPAGQAPRGGYSAELEQALHQTEPADFDLAARLRRQIEELRKVHCGVDIELQGADKPIRINGIADLIVQAVARLVDDAVDRHRPGSRISIICSVRPDSIELSVFHQGPPLPADMLDLPSGTSGCSGRDDEPAAGIDLQLAQRITQFHAGALRVANHSDPAGVLVSMTLPRLARPQRGASA